MFPTHHGVPVPSPAAPAQQSTSQGESKPGVDLSAITVSSRIPDFWTDLPRVWFIQFEAVIGPQHQPDVVKYNMVITKLGKNVIHQVSDILINPPDTDRYNAIKNRLLNIYEESETRKVQKLISEMELGDQRPSQLLRRMKDLARDKIPNATLKILWQGHLPSAARGILSVTESTDLDTLATIADQIMETTGFSQLAEVTPPSADTTTYQACSSDTSLLLAEIAKINTRIQHLECSRSRPQFKDYSHNRNYSRNRSSDRRYKSNDNLCFYHAKFKNKANKCVKPCAWKVTKPVSPNQGN